MKKYTANYAYSNSNFVIQNLPAPGDINNKYIPAICVLKNILQRGNPTFMSSYLQERIGKIHEGERFEEKIYLIDRQVPRWYHTIRGDAERGYYPAKIFLEEIIPEFLSEHRYIQQLMVPEVLISQIIGKDELVNEQVDFYLPQVRLVIEIDGQFHKEEANQVQDAERDRVLRENNVEVVRIDTKDIDGRSSVLKEKAQIIVNRLKQYWDRIEPYKIAYENTEVLLQDEYYNKTLLASAVIRFQIAILELMERSVLNLWDDKWNINIVENDVYGFAELAIQDLLIWLGHLCKLSKLEYKRPCVKTKTCPSNLEIDYDEESVNIDLSLLKRWTDENIFNTKLIYVRTDYFDDENYFKVSTADPIKYQIINDGEDSDVPDLEGLLNDIFGFKDGFRPGQLGIIINALGCNDTIGLLPTGSGKSLCYQFVALLQPCVSFIVCPIKALMYDQKENIERKHRITNNAFISSNQSPAEKESIQREFSKGRYQFIWISPERYQSKSFREYLGKLNINLTIGLAVIDEVHCLSEWGHSFRTSYLNLVRTIRKYCPSAWFLGLTATASSSVLHDLKVEFEIDNYNIKTLVSFSRDELNFHVYKDDGHNANEKFNVLASILNRKEREKGIFKVDGRNTQSGLIFTPFKGGSKGCYRLCQSLRSKYPGVDIRWYTGSVPYDNRRPVMGQAEFELHKRRAQKEYMDNIYPLLVANKAFGVGIDKENIRYTIHYTLPNSLESLYQEAGRAGRDRNEADCDVIYSQETLDGDTLKKLFDLNTDVDEIKRISDEVGFNQRDILGNFFLWLQSNLGVEKEFENIKFIIDRYAEPDAVKNVQCNNNFKMSDVEKAIYRLSLMGIVEDWTVESWQEYSAVFEVTFSNYTPESTLNSVIESIRKYDKEFDINQSYDDKPQYRRIVSIYRNDNIIQLDKSIKILLHWIYDNIAYGRRQALKTVMDQCENFSNSEDFKKVIDSYFRFDESTFVLDNIVEEPRKYDLWFQVFYEGDDFIGLNRVRELRSSLSRYLESYRYVTGLNFISGVSGLLLGDYKVNDGESRLESALEQISNYKKEDRLKILHGLLAFSDYLKDESKYHLSTVLIKYYPNELEVIYEGLRDDNTLMIILDGVNERLSKVLGGLY